MTEIDARGMRCPWPAIRLARALRDRVDGEVLVLADDPAAPRELAAVAADVGWWIIPEPTRAGAFRVARRTATQTGDIV